MTADPTTPRDPDPTCATPSPPTTSPPTPTATPPSAAAPSAPAEQVRQVVHLHQQGYGTREIARRVLRDRKTVRRILREQGLDPARHQGATSPATSKLDAFREAIEQRVQARLTTTRILREIRELGYTGGRTILADHVRCLQGSLAPQAKVKRRFETRPGEEMQVDWSVYTVPVASSPERVHALACVLAHSRLLHLRFYRDERESTLLEGLTRAFEAFHGVTQRVVFDNMATVVLGRIGRDRKPVWHPRFLDFARHHGFQPFLCRVRDPDRKGKSERMFDFLEKDLVRGSQFDSFDDLNERAERWCKQVANRRVHGTTGLVPEEAWLAERDLLIRLPEARFPVHQDAVREIDEDSTLSIGGRRYSVPATLGRRRAVAVRLYSERFEVLDERGGVAFGRCYAQPGDPARLQLDPSHYASLPRPSPSTTGHRLDEQLLERFPTLAALVAGIQQRMKSLAHVHLRALWRLAETHGEEAFLRAALRAQQYRRHDAGAVRRLLERDHPLPQAGPPILPVGEAARVCALLGEVDPGSLQGYAHLDTLTPTPEDAPAAPAIPGEEDAPRRGADHDEEDDHEA